MNRLWAVVSAVSSLLLLAIGLLLALVPVVMFFSVDANLQGATCCVAWLLLPAIAVAWTGIEGLRALRRGG